MKITIITVVYNNVNTIESTIQSVLNQTYSNIEYIIIDGISTDGTIDIVKKYQSYLTFISQSDNGMYDALNFGIGIATGEVVGIINADDRLADNFVIEKIANHFIKNIYIDCIIGDIAFVSKSDPDKIVRYYSSKNFKPSKFAWGFMPAHPSFFCKIKFFKLFGGYKTNFEIASDYELLIRFLFIHSLRYKYLNLLITKMNLGGKSTKNIFSTFKLNKEIIKACRLNGIKTNHLMIYSKYFLKVFELFRLKKKF